MGNVVVINAFDNSIEEIYNGGLNINHIILNRSIEESSYKFLGSLMKDKVYKLHHIKGLGFMLGEQFYEGSFFAIASDENFSTSYSSCKLIADSIEFYTNPLPEIMKLLFNSSKKLDNEFSLSPTSKKITYRVALKQLSKLPKSTHHNLFRFAYRLNCSFAANEGDESMIDELLTYFIYQK